MLRAMRATRVTRRPKVRVWACLSACLALAYPARAETSACATPAGEPARLDRIGDRNEIVLRDGRVVRIAGLDFGQAPPEGDGWPDYVALLTRNADLRLAILGDRDRWGRIPAHIFVRPDEAATEAWLQGYLLESGAARLRPEPDSVSCWSAMRSLEDGARTAKLGLWSSAAAVDTSARPAEMVAKRGTLAMVEGKIIGIGESRAVFYLNFGQSWRNDFTVIVLKRQTKQFEAAGLKPGELVGKQVRVRGVVDGRDGPRIEASMPEQIEKLD